MKPTFKTVTRFRIFFALQYAGVGIFFPYVALYLSSLDLTGAQIGLLLALLPLIGLIVQPIWGLVSDVNRWHRQALALACFGVVLAMVGFALTEDFRLLILFAVLHAIMKAPIGILVTALALEYLAREPEPIGFGSLRLWGSIGFAAASFMIGVFLVGDAIWWILPLYALTNLALGVVALTVPDAEVHGQVRWQDGLLLLGKERALTLFLVGAMLVGLTLGIVNNYLAIYLTDISAAGWVIGTSLAISALFEVPLMARVPAFLKRWGVRRVLVFGVAMLPIRWLLYTFINEPLLVLPTQVLHSIAMMSLLVVGVLYVDRLLEPQWRASGQALYTTFLHGLGPSVGLYAAGIIYQQAGIKPVWLLSFAAATLGTIVLGLVIRGGPTAQDRQKASL